MYAAEIRRAVEAAPRVKLPEVAALMWRAFGDGQVSEAEAEALSGLIEARQGLRQRSANLPDGQVLRSPDLASLNVGAAHISATGGKVENSHIASGLTEAPRSRTGSRPRTDASMARRRRWAASGRLPPALAARFTLAEQAVLAVLAVEVTKRGDCRLCHEHVAAAAGVSRSTVKTALREARRHGLVTIEERRLARYRNDTNVVRVVSQEWTAWLRLARSGERGAALRSGGGVKSPTRTNTPVSYPVNSEGRRGRKGCRGMEDELHRSGQSGIRAGGGIGRTAN